MAKKMEFVRHEKAEVGYWVFSENEDHTESFTLVDNEKLERMGFDAGPSCPSCPLCKKGRMLSQWTDCGCEECDTIAMSCDCEEPPCPECQAANWLKQKLKDEKKPKILGRIRAMHSADATNQTLAHVEVVGMPNLLPTHAGNVFAYDDQILIAACGHAVALGRACACEKKTGSDQRVRLGWGDQKAALENLSASAIAAASRPSPWRYTDGMLADMGQRQDVCKYAKRKLIKSTWVRYDAWPRQEAIRISGGTAEERVEIRLINSRQVDDARRIFMARHEADFRSTIQNTLQQWPICSQSGNTVDLVFEWTGTECVAAWECGHCKGLLT